MEKITDITIILPSYKPDEKLLKAVIELEKEGFNDIVVVNDGSGPEFEDKFNEVKERESVTLLVHPENLGKGCALKTAFKYVKENRNCAGVVTVDGDGQHLPKDVKACADKMRETNKVVLGCRDFSLPYVPPRSRRGNRLTSKVFKIFVHTECSDTQTGLRAIPFDMMEFMIGIRGDRYEYETNMLLMMKRNNYGFEEVKIETVYINENETSHFRPFVDAYRIYKLIFRYIFTSTFVMFFGSSMICYAFDWLLFTILELLLTGNEFLPEAVVTIAPYVIARLCSSAVNYTLNRRVFKTKKSVKSTLYKYYLLAFGIFAAGSILLYFVNMGFISIPAVAEYFNTDKARAMLKSIIKVPIDTVLYIVSYTVQKKLIFNSKN